ncbi:MAG: GspH/FimT family pseudopilin [Rubrivivax sp.]|jgi:type IV fimbrial biogenesis protein FimT
MKPTSPWRRLAAGFSLIELMVVVAVTAVVLTLAAPSFFDYQQVQRLKSVNSQVVTDMNLARSEAVSRGTFLRVSFGQNSTSTCYTLYLAQMNSLLCDCTKGPGEACKNNSGTVPINVSEVRTVVQPRSTGITILTPAQSDPKLAFNSTTGGILSIGVDTLGTPLQQFEIKVSLDDNRFLKTTLGKTGRPAVCASTTGLGSALC